jgi:hypothetical protein
VVVVVRVGWKRDEIPEVNGGCSEGRAENADLQQPGLLLPGTSPSPMAGI